MSDTAVEPRLITLMPSSVAVLREIVPMTALQPFFDRAFHAVPAVLSTQQIALSGPPLAVYFGMPSDTVDVAAGFASATPVSPESGVTPFTLPGGRAGRVLHHGSYDTLGQTYSALTEWMRGQGLVPGGLMWEAYLTEPGGDPAQQVTEITWPVVELSATENPALQ